MLRWLFRKNPQQAKEEQEILILATLEKSACALRLREIFGSDVRIQYQSARELIPEMTKQEFVLSKKETESIGGAKIAVTRFRITNRGARRLAELTSQYR